LDDEVLQVFTATLLLHYLDMKETYGSSLYIEKIHMCSRQIDITPMELVAISTALRASFFKEHLTSRSIGESCKDNVDDLVTQVQNQAKLIEEQAHLLQQSNERLVEMNKRLARIEKAVGIHESSDEHEVTPIHPTESPQKKRKEAPRSLANIWFNWYAQMEKARNPSISPQRFYDHKPNCSLHENVSI
jgi:TolA-binding protein